MKARTSVAVAAVAASILVSCTGPPPGPTTTTTTTSSTTTVPVSAIDQRLDWLFTAQSGVGAFNLGCDPIGGFEVWSLAGQTFTAGRTGVLDQVSLILSPASESSPRNQVRVAIQTLGADGYPTGTVIGSGLFDTTALAKLTDFTSPPWSDVALSAPANVVAGTRYALIVTTPNVCGSPDMLIFESSSTTDLYASGARVGRVKGAPWATFGTDLFFRTWVR
jgi:hypothetical protein